jgi:hypothetical protein
VVVFRRSGACRRRTHRAQDQELGIGRRLGAIAFRPRPRAAGVQAALLCCLLAVTAGTAFAQPDAIQSPRAHAAPGPPPPDGPHDQRSARPVRESAEADPSSAVEGRPAHSTRNESRPIPPLDSAYGPDSGGEHIPPGYRLEERRIKALTVTGPVVLGISYVGGLVVVSALGFPNSSGWLALPVAGPWVTLATRKDSCDLRPQRGCDGLDNLARFYLAVDGVAQLAGATVTIFGITVRRKRLVRDSISAIVIKPARIGSGYGLGAFGSF